MRASTHDWSDRRAAVPVAGLCRCCPPGRPQVMRVGLDAGGGGGRAWRRRRKCRGDPGSGISQSGPFLESHAVHQQPWGRRVGVEPGEDDSECAFAKSGEIDAEPLCRWHLADCSTTPQHQSVAEVAVSTVDAAPTLCSDRAASCSRPPRRIGCETTDPSADHG